MNLNQMIDHTLLKPDATKHEIIAKCEEAKKFKFAAVCVNGYYTKLVKEQLEGSEVKVCSVIGFPLGAMSTKSKAQEAANCIEDGADEIDMVINIGALKDHDDEIVENDIAAVVEKSGNAIVKVIIETCLLNEEEKRRACLLGLKAGADFIKTSTGFSTGGAKVEDIKLIRSIVGNKARIKASGGIKTHKDALKMIEAGADRIGTSNGIQLL